jgi:transketolase
VVFDTVKGRGLHFEGRLESHYLPLTEEQYQTAMAHCMCEVPS